MVKPRVSQGETLKSAADLLDSAPAILIEVPMRRIGLVVLLAVILAWEPISGAQPEGKTRVIGFLGPPPSAGGLVQAFQQGLRDLGYVEGQNIRVEYRYTDAPLQGDIDRMAQLAAELVRLKPDVLVGSITEAALAAKGVTRTIPIVMANAAAVRTPAELQKAFAPLPSDRVGAVLLFPDGTFYLNRPHIAALALRYRLPAIFQNREFVDAGGLLSYAPSSASNYRRAAMYVDKILKGAKPADLPVEQPTKFELVINLKTAKVFGLTIPQSLVLRADQVIE